VLDPKFETFFLPLFYTAVHRLLMYDGRLCSAPLPHFVPCEPWFDLLKREGRVVPLAADPLRARAFCVSTDTSRSVVKVFHDTSRLANLGILNRVLGSEDHPYFPDAKVDLTLNGVGYLQYTWMEGSHIASRFDQFGDILTALLALHEERIVHGDIRSANLLFRDAESKLLDFDLSGKVDGRTYPPGFQRDIGDDGQRHPEAEAGADLALEHDHHALAFVMRQYTAATAAMRELWTNAIGFVEEGKLKDALDCCSYGDRRGLARLSDARASMPCGTGSPPRK
jgi:hypothetical protein